MHINVFFFNLSCYTVYDNAHLCFDVDVIFTLSQYFLFSLKTSFLMKTTLWKYQTLALLLSSEREKSSEVQMTLYSIIFDNVFFNTVF